MGSTQSGIGETLRAERLRQKKSVEDISRATRISARMLEAIERDEFEALPGVLFARNFVRQYAAALGLDPAPFSDRMPKPDIAAAPLPAAPEGPGHRSFTWDSSWNSAIVSAVWLVLGAVAATAAYVHFNAPLQTQQRIAAYQAVHAPVAPEKKAPPEPRPADRDVVAGMQPSHLQTVADTIAGPGAAPAAAGPAAPAGKVNVAITAHADSWIQVSSDGKTLYTGTLKPNESKEFSSGDAVKLIAGNAGGITVALNGRTLDSLGASGQVRVLQLTEAGPQTAAVSPNDPNRL